MNRGTIFIIKALRYQFGNVSGIFHIIVEKKRTPKKSKEQNDKQGEEAGNEKKS